MEIAILVVAAIVGFIVLRAVLNFVFRLVGVAAIVAFMYFVAIPYAQANGIL